MKSQAITKLETEFEFLGIHGLAFEEFDAWMTRQVNCLVGRNLRFASPASAKSATGRGRSGSLETGKRTAGR